MPDVIDEIRINQCRYNRVRFTIIYLKDITIETVCTELDSSGSGHRPATSRCEHDKFQ
jgi:hypothetical protein